MFETPRKRCVFATALVFGWPGSAGGAFNNQIAAASDVPVRRTPGPARTSLLTVQTPLRRERSTTATTVRKILAKADLLENLAQKMPKESICVKPSTAAGKRPESAADRG